MNGKRLVAIGHTVNGVLKIDTEEEVDDGYFIDELVRCRGCHNWVDVEGEAFCPVCHPEMMRGKRDKNIVGK